MSRLLLSTAVAGLMLGATGGALASANNVSGVSVQQAKPQVDVQRVGEADVQVEQAKPEVNVEYGQNQQQGQQSGSVGSEQAGKQTAQNQLPANAGGTVIASDVIGMNLASADGQDLGEVDDIVYDTSGQYYLVVTHGGFLGLGEEKSYVPMELVGFSDDALIVTSAADLQPNYDPNGFTPVDRNFEIRTNK